MGQLDLDEYAYFVVMARMLETSGGGVVMSCSPIVLRGQEMVGYIYGEIERLEALEHSTLLVCTQA